MDYATFPSTSGTLEYRDRSWQYIASLSLFSSLHWHQFIVIYSDEYVIFSRNNKLYLNLN
jgi:hypothetical protein